MAKFLKRILIPGAALLLAILLPFGAVAYVAFGMEPIYGETFLGELAEKYDRLTETEDGKIILIGGSSVAFGIDSSLIEQYTGRKVVNFGLYATLGTKMMLDLARANIAEGDLILLAPEMDAQTLSLYFNAEAAWQALESNYGMLCYIDDDNYGDLAGGIFGYVKAKLGYHYDGTVPRPTGIYRRDSFNAYGDIAAARASNIMTLGYDANRPITLSADLFDADFVTYLNTFIYDAEKAGAEVVFSFCPMNADALTDDMTPEAIEQFYRDVCALVKCPVITAVTDSIMDAGYFYDTNFHLNDAGVIFHTAALIDDLDRYWGKTEVHSIEVPGVPGGDTPDTPIVVDPDTKDPWEKYFLYETYGKARGIVGVTDEGKALSSLALPRTAEGMVVRILCKDALKGCNALTALIVYENITLLEDGCLAGAPNLKRIEMRRDTCDELEAGENLFSGAPSDLYVYLYSEQSYDNFTAGYWWSVHSARLKKGF